MDHFVSFSKLYSVWRHQLISVLVKRILWLILILNGSATPFCYGQLVTESFGNNAVTVHWKQRETKHFNIVTPARYTELSKRAAVLSEQIYASFKKMLGVAPDKKITLYINDEDELISANRAKEKDFNSNIWKNNSYLDNISSGRQLFMPSLRYEIALVFQEHVEDSPLGFAQYLFSWPSPSPWSEGLAAYLSIPDHTYFDEQWIRNYWYSQLQSGDRVYWAKKFADIIKGRSQIQFFNTLYSSDTLHQLYGHEDDFAGIPYFDFNTAFLKATQSTYPHFENMWKAKQLKDYHQQMDHSYNGSQGHDYPPLKQAKKVRSYLGINVERPADYLAMISLPKSGRLLQQLDVLSVHKKRRAILHIDEGYFHPVMAWQPKQDRLVYSKRRYGGYGNYHNELIISDRDGKNKHYLTKKKHAILPAFSLDGQQLAYVSRQKERNTIRIRLMNKSDNDIPLRAFGPDTTIQHLDWSPVDQHLLVSFQVRGMAAGAGILGVQTKRFSVISLQGHMPLHAQWGPKGKHIYFNKLLRSVSNLFVADISNNELSNIYPVTSSFRGAELWDVVFDSVGQVSLLAKTMSSFGRNQLTVYLAPKNEHPISSATQYRKPKHPDLKLKPKAVDVNNTSSSSFPVHSYNSLSHITVHRPIVLPYYITPADFGLGTYTSWTEPLHKHKISLAGILSVADPLHKSLFYTSYTNNMFKPQLRLAYNHFSAASDLLRNSLEVDKKNVITLSSLWKLNGLSHNYSRWYLGLMLRHIAFNYFQDQELHKDHPAIIFDNKKEQQTDARLSLTWRVLKPYRHTLIHPLDGIGLRFSTTVSDKILASDVRYARFNLEGYTILPGIGDNRILLHAKGAFDRGQPAGRDYLALSDKGDYQLPKASFNGRIDPGVEQFIRGYSRPVLGRRFLGGTIEYRIPLLLDSSSKWLGFIPPARTALAIFGDAGVMGGAREEHQFSPHTVSRYSIGAEIKRVFGFEDFKLTYEFGLAQPLNKSIKPKAYFNIKSAIPF